MSSLPAARISHFTTRRLRLKVPEKRRDTVFFNDAAARLAAWDSVERVETNPLTASILIHFSDPERLLLEAAAKNDLFDIEFETALMESPGPVVRRAAVNSFERADDIVRRWTQSQLDLRGVIFLLLFIGGAYQLFRGRIGSPAPTLLWHAGDLLGLWSPPPTDAMAEASSGPQSG
jgi:hypothetical protein